MIVSDRMRWVVIAMAGFALLVGGCGGDASTASDGEEPLTGERSTAPPADRPSPAPAQAGDACSPGANQPCNCVDADGETFQGSQTCTVDGWSECACSVPWPWLGPTCDDGRVECAPLASEATDFAGSFCCTGAEDVAAGIASAPGLCGVTNNTAFGTHAFGPPVCVEAGYHPRGKPTTDCRTEDELAPLPFVELADCCRPDGTCGFWLNYPNWDDLGCMERTEMANLLDGSALLFFFVCFNGDCDAVKKLAAQPGRSCTYQ